MADLMGLELARPGEWKLASGPLTLTAEMLDDAARFAQRPGARPAPVKIGHSDPRFDGEPALGWLANFRVEDDDGPVLLADVTGMPDWLAAAAKDHWPDRSIEGWTDFKADDGEKYALVIDGLALLGVTPPGMSTIRSLRDLPQALGVAASARVVASFVAAAVSDTPWSRFSQADYTPQQWRRACLIDTGEGETDSKARYKLPIREPSGTLNRNGVHAAASALAGGRGGVQATPEQKARAARALVRAYGELGEDPPESLRRMTAALGAAVVHAAATRTTPEVQEGAGMDPAKIREALGLQADASDDEVKAALVSSGLAAQPTPPTPNPQPDPQADPAPTTPDAASPKPELVHAAGTMVIDASAWTEREDRIKRLEAQAAKQSRDERDKVIAEAVADGKFAPSRKEHWVRLWDADPEGTRQVIAGLTRNVIPTAELGYAGDDADGIDDEFKSLFPPVPSQKGA